MDGKGRGPLVELLRARIMSLLEYIHRLQVK